MRIGIGIGIGLAAVVAAGTSGCGRATQLAQVWKDPAADSITFQNAAVVLMETGVQRAIVMNVAGMRTTERWVGGLNYMTPRYKVTDTTVIVDTRVYSLPDGKVLFSARSETVNPGSEADLTESVMRNVLAELRHDSLQPK